MASIDSFESSAPKVSVALATYNGEKYLSALLESIARQTWIPFEIIVSDDASTDSTLDVLCGFESALPLKISAHVERLGVIANFNRALSSCGGDYIALADQDDVWLPEKISKLMEKMLEQEALLGKETPTLIFSNLNIVDDKLQKIPPFRFLKSVYETQERQQLIDLLVKNSIPGCAMLINRALLQRAMPIPKNFFMHDWWLALTATTFGVIKGVDSSLVEYRQHQTNYSGAYPLQVSFGLNLLKKRTWSDFIELSTNRVRVITANLKEFEARYGTVLPANTQKVISRFRRHFNSPLNRQRYALRTHSSFKFWLLYQKLGALLN